MKTILTILIITLSGCSLFQKPCRNVERLIKKFPECFDAIKKDISLDTTLPEIKIVVEKELIIDSAANDSIMALLDSCKNSMTIEERIVYRDKIKEIILNNLEIEPTDTTVDNLNIKIWIENGKLRTEFTRLETPMSVTGETTALQVKPQKKNLIEKIVGLIILIAILAAIGYLLYILRNVLTIKLPEKK